jgi:hypothetical protein
MKTEKELENQKHWRNPGWMNLLRGSYQNLKRRHWQKMIQQSYRKASQNA